MYWGRKIMYWRLLLLFLDEVQWLRSQKNIDTLKVAVIFVSVYLLSLQVLAKKVHTLYSLAVQQLSKQDHYDFGLRGLTSLLRYAGKKKRANPTFSDEEVVYFFDSNVFAGTVFVHLMLQRLSAKRFTRSKVVITTLPKLLPNFGYYQSGKITILLYTLTGALLYFWDSTLKPSLLSVKILQYHYIFFCANFTLWFHCQANYCSKTG